MKERCKSVQGSRRGWTPFETKVLFLTLFLSNATQPRPLLTKITPTVEDYCFLEHFKPEFENIIPEKTRIQKFLLRKLVYQFLKNWHDAR